MARRRFFVPQVHNEFAELVGDEARHLTHVLRVEKGQKYEISDNSQVWLAEVDTARKDRVVFRTLEKLSAEEQLFHVTACVALIKFDHLEWIFEKGTELGVEKFVLVEAVRSEHGLERAAEKRMSRWNRIVLESSQQSRRSHLPAIEEPVELHAALKTEGEHRLFLDEARTGVPILRAIEKPAKGDRVSVLIGPEGGWTDSEREQVLAAGWTSVSLGAQILRAETALLAAVATVNAVYAEIGIR